MKINRNGLDEMQKSRRNTIGNNLFMLMFFALLIDVGLQGMGIRWLNYPANIMVIIMVCMGIYLISIIATNAYMPPKVNNRKHLVLIIVAIAFSVIMAIAAYNLFGITSTQSHGEYATDNSALILFIISGVGLLISIVIALLKKVNNKNYEDD